ncbi:MAG: hypothetical protein NZM11_03480 [Anaerolineales bacterium]|nr:hypothetical protein [Anaerolineales bacterium]
MPTLVIAHRTWPGRSQPPAAPSVSPTLITLGEALQLRLDPEGLTLHFVAQPGVLHYFRLTDATLVPLPPAHSPAFHRPLPRHAHWHGPTLTLSAGDAYIALSPGAARIADSPTVARFLHLRDSFNAEKLAEALLAHLLELAGGNPLAEAFTVLVVEAR